MKSKLDPPVEWNGAFVPTDQYDNAFVVPNDCDGLDGHDNEAEWAWTEWLYEVLDDKDYGWNGWHDMFVTFAEDDMPWNRWAERHEALDWEDVGWTPWWWYEPDEVVEPWQAEVFASGLPIEPDEALLLTIEPGDALSIRLERKRARIQAAIEREKRFAKTLTWQHAGF